MVVGVVVLEEMVSDGASRAMGWELRLTGISDGRCVSRDYLDEDLQGAPEAEIEDAS